MNRILATTLSCLALVGAAWADDPAPRYTAKQFYETTAAAGASFSADESRILFSSDATGIFNVYSVPVAGGKPTQLTDSRQDAFRAVSFFPNDNRFLYAADQGGNEISHLYVKETNGSTKDLTPGEKTKAQFVLTNERDPRHFDLYRYNVDGYASELAFKNEGGFNVSDFSPAGDHDIREFSARVLATGVWRDSNPEYSRQSLGNDLNHPHPAPLRSSPPGAGL